MKKTEFYQCEICGSQYTNEVDALKCEAMHKKIVEIAGAKYSGLAVYKNVRGYPDLVTIKFDDGEEISYIRWDKI